MSPVLIATLRTIAVALVTAISTILISELDDSNDQSQQQEIPKLRTDHAYCSPQTHKSRCRCRCDLGGATYHYEPDAWLVAYDHPC